jgi:hypothetical protein
MRLLLEVELSFLPDACPSLGARPSLFHIQNLKILVAKRLGLIQQILADTPLTPMLTIFWPRTWSAT